MAELSGQIGEVRMTVQVTRKATGETENYDLVGFLDEDQVKELQNGSHALDSGA